ncbi:hypothetical protein PAXRUDRAFT_328121 [Paxillus rubicundulus Ve08.2h10]|uniref:Uncharacterized protein n=1 Tax=Paxillus rubicundulus Ve08.2h10 TaxID=930991 RepID=A0A0D0DEX8_9AGAM|nr:hypothetical protein PAXRUDRAFT_328121 [Paxillus rubicundulus Ve08.2h10]
MDHSHLQGDEEDQDSLFGSPPPSPARGRSPSPSITGGGISHGVTTPSMGVGTGAPRKNVGTIALPGSHMSCSELPADLSASCTPPSLPTSGPSSLAPSQCRSAGTPILTFAADRVSQPSTRAASVLSSLHKATSATPAPPIPLPGPDEPTPPNFLRSQSALLGLAGLVGCVKPAQLHAREREHTPMHPSRPRSLHCGSTPSHPIVLDDDQENLGIEQRPISQAQLSRRLDQVNTGALRANMLDSLANEKNVFPVLESLVKFLGGDPHVPPPESFARPYGYGIFDTPFPPAASPVAPLSASGDTLTPSTHPPPLKRRKLRHVPAGAADWDIPFPFAAGEGPEAYRDTWARERAKRLVTQLLGLVKDSTKRVTTKTTKSTTRRGRGRPPKSITGARNCRSSRDMSVETRDGRCSAVSADTPEFVQCESPTADGAFGAIDSGLQSTPTPTVDLNHFLSSLDASEAADLTSTQGSKDGWPADSEGMAIDGSIPESAPFDHAAFEEWLSQLQQFVPSDTDAPTPGWESNMFHPLDCDTSNVDIDMTSTSLPAGSGASSCPASVSASVRDFSEAARTVPDEVIDPDLLAVSHPAASTSLQPQSSPSPSAFILTQSADTAHGILNALSPPSALTFSPRTSLSSLTEPLTPPSDTFAETPTTVVRQEHELDLPLPATEVPKTIGKAPDSHPESQALNQALTRRPSPLTELAVAQPPLTATQKGKAKATPAVASKASSASTRRPSNTGTAAKAPLAKGAILERARKWRRQIAAEIERAKIEQWETSIEGGVLVHLLRDGSL